MIAAVTINNGAKLYTFDRNTSTISQPKGSDYFPNRTRHSQFPHDRPEGHPAYQKLPTHKRRDLLFSRSAWER
jgi:hypothetical protein